MTTVATLAIEWVAKVEKLNNAVDATAKNTKKIEDAARSASNIATSNFKGVSDSIQKVAKDAGTAGQDISKLSALEARAAVAASQLNVAEKNAALSLKKASDAANSGKASIEQVAVAQSRAALAADRVKVAENSAASAMSKAEAEAKRLSDAMGQGASKSNIFARGLDTIHASSGKVASAVKGVAVVGVAALASATIALGGALASTIKPAADFEATMLSIYSTNDISKQKIDELSDSLLSMAGEVGQSPQQLAEGLYFVMGAGYESAAAMDILERSAKAAAVGMTDTEVVANAVTAVLKTFPALKVADAMDMMTASVATGKTEWADYANVIGKVAVNAKQAGLRFTEATSAFSILTNVMPNSEQAADSLNSLLQTSSRFETLSDRAKNLGIAFDTDAYKSMTLIGRLEYLQKATGGSAEQMTKLLGQENATAAATALLANDAKDYTAALEGIAESTGKADEAFAKSQGAQATWNKATAAAEALQVKIGTALLPVINSFTTQIAPMIMNLMTWVTENQVLEKTISAISTALGTMVSIGSNVVSFFQNNQVAMALLQGTLVSIGILILVALVPAFIAWAIAAGAAAIATLAATWPILLIGALIALVVAGIILAVQNWGAIVAWLSGVWNAFAAWFMGILGSIGAFFTGIWTGIATFFTGLWNGIVAFIAGVWAGIIAGIQAAWNWIIAIVIAAGAFLLAAIMAPFIAIGNAFIWLYNHNYYFQALVDAIVGIVRIGVAWLQQAWTDVINWIVGAWQWIVSKATELWTNVSNAVRDGFNAAIGFVRWVWEQISSFFVNAWNSYIVGPLTSLWNNVSSFFAGAWSNYVVGPLTSLWTNVSSVFSSAWSNYVSGPINSLWNTLSTTVSGWATSALQWGKNLIQSFIDGIKNKAGEIGSALTDTAGKIASFLGFHSPTKEGPGRYADKWAPAFVDMYAKGIEAGIPKIQGAVGKLAMPIGTNFAPMRYSAKSSSSASSPIVNVINENYTQVILDGKELTETAGRRIVRESRKQGVGR